MKKILIAISICGFLQSAAQGQKITDDEARKFADQVWGYIKTSDSLSFINLWAAEDSAWQKLHSHLSEMELADRFNKIKDFLGPAISENSNIDHVSVGKPDPRGIEITAYFMTKENIKRGFSLFVVYLNKRWVARGQPGILKIYGVYK